MNKLNLVALKSAQKTYCDKKGAKTAPLCRSIKSWLPRGAFEKKVEHPLFVGIHGPYLQPKKPHSSMQMRTSIRSTFGLDCRDWGIIMCVLEWHGSAMARYWCMRRPCQSSAFIQCSPVSNSVCIECTSNCCSNIIWLQSTAEKGGQSCHILSQCMVRVL